MKNLNKGFTLIELLVVIAIIALLSTIVLANLMQSRTRAQNIKKLQSAMEVQKAIELYKTTYSVYPGEGGGGSYFDYIDSRKDTGVNLETDLSPFLKMSSDMFIVNGKGYFYYFDYEFTNENKFSCGQPWNSSLNLPYLIIFNSTTPLNLQELYLRGNVSSPPSYCLTSK